MGTIGTSHLEKQILGSYFIKHDVELFQDFGDLKTQKKNSIKKWSRRDE